MFHPRPPTHASIPAQPTHPQKLYLGDNLGGESMEVAEGQQETWLSAWLTVRL